MDASARATILIWAADPDAVEALTSALMEPDRELLVLEDDAQLASRTCATTLLVCQASPRVEAQQAFLRGAIILVDPKYVTSPPLQRRVYSTVTNATEASLAVDQFLAHRRLAEQVAGQRASPRRCSRCGRGFDALKARQGGTARRFVRFGSIALCGGCVDSLRRLLHGATAGLVEADA